MQVYNYIFFQHSKTHNIVYILTRAHKCNILVYSIRLQLSIQFLCIYASFFLLCWRSIRQSSRFVRYTVATYYKSDRVNVASYSIEENQWERTNYSINDTKYYLINIYLDKFRKTFPLEPYSTTLLLLKFSVQFLLYLKHYISYQIHQYIGTWRTYKKS